MGTHSPHDRQGTSCWQRISLFRGLVLILVILAAFFVVKDWLLAPPSATRRFSQPPARVVISLGTVGGRSDFLADSLPSLFNQV